MGNLLVERKIIDNIVLLTGEPFLPFNPIGPGSGYRNIRRNQAIEIITIVSDNIYAVYCSNTGSIRDDPYCATKENSLELIELSSINKVSLD